MARLLIIAALLLTLITFATIELIWVRDIYNDLDSNLSTLREGMQGERIDTAENIKLSDHMYSQWLKDERRLVMLTRHSDLMQVSDALIYIKNFIYFDNKEEVMAGVLRLQYLIDTHRFNIATSPRNII